MSKALPARADDDDANRDDTNPFHARSPAAPANSANSASTFAAHSGDPLTESGKFKY